MTFHPKYIIITLTGYACGERFMNKKLIASLLTLGLILSPVSGQVGSGSMVSEARADESDVKKEFAQAFTYFINASVGRYDKVKASQLYRHATTEEQEKLDKVMKDAKTYVDGSNVTFDGLKEHNDKIIKASSQLAKEANDNVKNLKKEVVYSSKLIENNSGKANDAEYKQLKDKIDEAKGVLKNENLANVKGDDLKTETLELKNLFIQARDAFGDTNEYREPNSTDIESLDKEINNIGNFVTTETKSDDLLLDANKFKDSHDSFTKSNEYSHSDLAKKEAYDKAYGELENVLKLGENEEKDKKLLLALKNIAEARYQIDKRDLKLNSIKLYPYNGIDDSVVSIIENIDSIERKSFDLIKNLKDKALGDSFRDALSKAKALAYNYVNGYERDYKELNKLNDNLNKIVEQIKKSKGEVEVRPEDKKKEKIEKIDKLLDRVKLLIGTDSYKKGNSTDKKALEDAVKVAEDLKRAYGISEALVSEDKLSEAINKLEKAYAKFEKSDDKALVKKLIEDLLKSTEGIRIDQIYGNNEKDAKNAYTKAREAAAKAAKDKNISLADLTKAYENFKDARDKLAEFLTSRLKKLVDDDSNFVDTEKYKEADRSLDAKDVDSILNYRSLIRDSKEELDKISPDANKLDLLYKKLDAARREIEGKLSSQARKLTDAILDSDDFMASLAFKAAATGSDKYLKYAAEKYKADLERAKKLSEAGKLDSKEAETILESLSKSRDFIEDKISKKTYLIFEYTRTLEEIKNHKDYKTLNQALRKRLEDALDLAHKGGDEDVIFRTLDEVMNDDSIKAFIKKIELEKNPNKVRDKLLIDLTNLINEDKKLKEGSFKYTKAQKALRDAYDLALKEAKDLIADNKNPKEAEVKAVYQKLLKAKNALDGDKFEKLMNDLAARFKKNQLKIGSVEARKAIAAKINALSDPKATMDDALRVEKELDDLINPKYAATTTLTPTNQVQTSTRPVSTVTKPGSIVKTGINGIAKVAAVLVVAAIILKLTSKKGDKK